MPTVALVSLHVGKDRAQAITADATIRDGDRERKGPIAIQLIRIDNRWLIRDIDFETAETAKDEVRRFLARFPDARPVIGKAGK
jgi:hypothetical protein